MRSLIHSGFVLAALLCFGSVARAENSICDAITGNLVQNCGFEATPIAADSDVPTDWMGAQFTYYDEVESGLVNSGDYALQFANDEFQGGPLFNGAAILSQNFTDTPGEQYTLEFYVLNGARQEGGELLQAFWGTQASPTSATPLLDDDGSSDSGRWTEYTYTVSGTGSDSITFTSYNDPGYFYLDDVSLVDAGVNTAAAPEPATIFLTIGALAGLGLVRRRRAA